MTIVSDQTFGNKELDDLNPQVKWNWRRKKKHVKKIATDIIRTGYFEGCDCKPYKLENITHPKWIHTRGNVFSADCDGVALNGNAGYSCSLFSCAPLALSKEEAYKMLEQNGVE